MISFLTLPKELWLGLAGCLLSRGGWEGSLGIPAAALWMCPGSLRGSPRSPGSCCGTGHRQQGLGLEWVCSRNSLLVGPSPLAQGWEGWSRAVASDRSLLQVTQPTGSSASHSRLPELWILDSSNPAREAERQRGFFTQTVGLGVATPELPGDPPDPSQGWVWSSVLAFGCQGSLRVQILSHTHREPFIPTTTAAPRQGCSKDSRLRPWGDQSPGQLGSDTFRRTDSSFHLSW